MLRTRHKASGYSERYWGSTASFPYITSKIKAQAFDSAHGFKFQGVSFDTIIPIVYQKLG